MSIASARAPAPTPVQNLLDALRPYTVTEECLYLLYARLNQWPLADLGRYFAEEDYWRLFRRVCRRLGVGRSHPTDCVVGDPGVGSVR
jgi:hypothetical protein